jgi:hypothetical protein
MKRRIIISVLCMALLASMLSISAYANDGKDYSGAGRNAVGKVEKVESKILPTLPGSSNDGTERKSVDTRFKTKYYVTDDTNGDFIFWNRSKNFTLYKGQKLYVDFTVFDTWESWYTIPSVDILNSNKNIVTGYYPAGSSLVVTPDWWGDYTGYLDIGSGKLKAGKYYLDINAMPCYSNGIWADDYYDFDIPVERVAFNIKALPKPTKLKLKVGKKRVNITFKKSTGAQKYEIYRSTKKSGGYKKIATVKTNKYTDKKVSKKKRYYYKVRAYRGSTKAGVARSSFTSPVRSAKVK